MIGYIKTFKDKNTKLMSFHIDHGKLLKKYRCFIQGISKSDAIHLLENYHQVIYIYI